MALLGLPHRVVNSFIDSSHNWEWLRNLQLTGDDIADDAITASEIAAGAVTNTELAGGVKNYGIVTALPGSPVTGDQCTYTDSLTAPTYAWQFVYDGSQSASNKWLCIGGSPMYATDDTSRTTTSTSYVSLTSPLSLTVPLAGDYDIRIGCALSYATSEYAILSYAVGGTAASDNWATYGASNATTLAEQGQEKSNRHAGVAASAAITEKARSGLGATVTFSRRRLWVMPVRVG